MSGMNAAMMRASIGLLPAAMLLASVSVRADDRLITRTYDPDEVVKISGRVGVQATIGFGDKESIENVAVGDAESWQITPNKRADLLFVKPLAANARTNMTVVTDKHTYFFDLVASPGAKPLYMLRFAYKEPAKASPLPGQQPGAALTEGERQVLDGDLAAAPLDPAMLNFAWRRNGTASLLPSRVYDDGDATYLLWGAKQEVPAILTVNEKGEEGPVNYAVRGPALVIDSVPSKLVFRIGKKSATLENLRPAQQQPSAPATPAGAPAAPAVAASPAPEDQGQLQ